MTKTDEHTPPSTRSWPTFPRFPHSPLFLSVVLSRTGIGDQFMQYAHALFLARKYETNVMEMELKQPSTRWKNFLGLHVGELDEDSLKLHLAAHPTFDPLIESNRSFSFGAAAAASKKRPKDVDMEYKEFGRNDWKGVEKWIIEQKHALNMKQQQLMKEAGDSAIQSAMRSQGLNATAAEVFVNSSSAPPPIPPPLPKQLVYKHVFLPSWEFVCVYPEIVGVARAKMCGAQRGMRKLGVVPRMDLMGAFTGEDTSESVETQQPPNLWIGMHRRVSEARQRWIATRTDPDPTSSGTSADKSYHQPRSFLIAAHYRGGDIAFDDASKLGKRLPQLSFASSLATLTKLVAEEFGMRPLIAVFTQRPRNESVETYFRPMYEYLERQQILEYEYTESASHGAAQSKGGGAKARYQFGRVADHVNVFADYKSEWSLLHMIHAHLFLASGSHFSQLALYLRHPTLINVAWREKVGSCSNMADLTWDGGMDVEALRKRIKVYLETFGREEKQPSPNAQQHQGLHTFRHVPLPAEDSMEDCLNLADPTWIAWPGVEPTKLTVNASLTYAEQGL